MNDQEPIHCIQCKTSLEGKRYVYLYKGDQLIEAHCFDCDRKNSIKSYVETGKLRTALINTVSLDLNDISRPWSHRDKDPYTYNLPTFRQVFDSGSEETLKEVQTLLSIWMDYKKIYQAIKIFERDVWFNGLSKITHKSARKGMSAKLMSTKCLTFTMCGRTMITIEDDKASVTMMCNEDGEELSMGFRGVDATAQEAIDLINLMIDSFKNGLLKFADDDEVSYCGM